MKFCKTCQQSKDESGFHNDKTARDGLSYVCKECAIRKSREWYKNNHDRAIERNREHNKVHSKEHTRKALEWAKNNPERRFKIHRKWYDANKEEKAIRDREWRKGRVERGRELARIATAKRRLNPKHRIALNISRSINDTLHRGKGRRHWENVVGYTINDLIKHLARKFLPGMSWENYGKEWHIDHIIPISAFNFMSYNDIDFVRCWSLRNLRPLWKIDNIKKGDNLERPFQPALAIAC